MRESLAKPLVITVSLLMVPLVGIAVVFGPPELQGTDLTLLDVGSHTGVPSAALGNAARASAFVPESTLPAPEATVAPRSRSASIPARRIAPRVVPAPEAVPARDAPLRVLERTSLDLQLADVDTSHEETLRLLERMRERVRLVDIAERVRRGETRTARSSLHSSRRASPQTLGWSPSAAEVEASLAQRALKASSDRDVALAALRSNPNPRTAREVADLASTCYERGASDLAEDLERSSSMLVSWSRASDLTVTGRFDRRGYGGGDLELTLERRGSLREPLAVSFPPGTYGASLSRVERSRSGRVFPKAQDLAFLRAPIVILEAGQARATIQVPVACASYGDDSPKADHPYELASFKKGSKVDKLMIALCAGEQKDDSEAQLAVWIARNDLRRRSFLTRGSGLRTFHRFSPIGAEHMRGAARQLLDAGVNPHETQFFPAPPAATPSRARRARQRPATPSRSRPAPTQAEVSVIQS